MHLIIYSRRSYDIIKKMIQYHKVSNKTVQYYIKQCWGGGIA